MTSGSVLSIPLNAISFALLARLLGPADLGRYALLVAAITVVITITTFRLETHLLVCLKEADPGERTTTEFEVAVRASLLLTVPFVSLALLLTALFPLPGLAWWVVAFAAVEVLLAPLLFVRSVLTARARQRNLATATLLGRAVWLLWIAVLFFVGWPSLPAIIGGRIVSLLVEALLLSLGASMGLLPRWPTALRDEVSALRQSAPLALAGIAGAGYNRIDQFLVAAFVGPRATGLYASGVRFAELIRTVPAVAQNVITPALVVLNSPEDQFEFKRAFRDGVVLMLVPAGFLAAVIMGSARQLIDLTLGSEYRGATTALRILSLAEIPTALASAASLAVLAMGYRRLLASSTLLGLLLNVAFNLILIPRFGIDGAAYGSLIAYSGVCARILLSRRIRSLGVGEVFGLLLRTLFCLALAVALASQFDSLMLSVGATAIAYTSSVGFLFASDIRRIYRIFVQPRRRDP